MCPRTTTLPKSLSKRETLDGSTVSPRRVALPKEYPAVPRRGRKKKSPHVKIVLDTENLAMTFGQYSIEVGRDPFLGNGVCIDGWLNRIRHQRFEPAKALPFFENRGAFSAATFHFLRRATATSWAIANKGPGQSPGAFVNRCSRRRSRPVSSVCLGLLLWMSELSRSKQTISIYEQHDFNRIPRSSCESILDPARRS